MKQLSAFLLTALLGFQAFYQAGLVTWFYANQESIAIVHCVNKNKPQMHCDGKCYLAKKMKQADQDGSATIPGNNSRTEPIVYLAGGTWALNPLGLTRSNRYFTQHQVVHSLPTDNIFHPPRLPIS